MLTGKDYEEIKSECELMPKVAVRLQISGPLAPGADLELDTFRVALAINPEMTERDPGSPRPVLKLTVQEARTLLRLLNQSVDKYDEFEALLQSSE